MKGIGRSVGHPFASEVIYAVREAAEGGAGVAVGEVEVPAVCGAVVESEFSAEAAGAAGVIFWPMRYAACSGAVWGTAHSITLDQMILSRPVRHPRCESAP